MVLVYPYFSGGYTVLYSILIYKKQQKFTLSYISDLLWARSVPPRDIYQKFPHPDILRKFPYTTIKHLPLSWYTVQYCTVQCTARIAEMSPFPSMQWTFRPLWYKVDTSPVLIYCGHFPHSENFPCPNMYITESSPVLSDFLTLVVTNCTYEDFK